MQERHNSIANALELRLSGTNPLIWSMYYFEFSMVVENDWLKNFLDINDMELSGAYIDGILPKGPYPPCLRMADRALLAGYPRYVTCLWTSKSVLQSGEDFSFSIHIATLTPLTPTREIFRQNLNLSFNWYKT